MTPLSEPSSTAWPPPPCARASPTPSTPRLRTPLGRAAVVQGERGVLRIAFEERAGGRTLAGVAAGVGPRIVRSDRELAATPRRALRLPRGRRRHARRCRSTCRSARGRSAAPCSRRCTARSTAARSSPTARWPRQAGNPRAVRATGTACATNPVPIVVPCHRVLPASGRLGNYGGGPGPQARAARRSRARPGGPEPLPRAAAAAGGARAAGGLRGGRDADRHVRSGDPAAGAGRDRARSPRGRRGRRRSGSPTRSARSPRGA